MAVWNGTKDFPYFILKVCSCKMKRYSKVRLFPRKVNIKPLFYFFKKGNFFFLMFFVQIKRKMARSRKWTARRYRKSGSFITLTGKARRLQHKNGKALPFMQGRAIFVNTSYLKILARTEKVTHNSENCRKISD